MIEAGYYWVRWKDSPNEITIMSYDPPGKHLPRAYWGRCGTDDGYCDYEFAEEFEVVAKVNPPLEAPHAKII